MPVKQYHYLLTNLDTFKVLHGQVSVYQLTRLDHVSGRGVAKSALLAAGGQKPPEPRKRQPYA